MDYKMYIIINDDLKMGTGKKISQAAHAVQSIVEVMYNNKKELLKKCGQAKIVLKATEEQMLELINIHDGKLKYILDAGHTQVEPGSLTALAFYPMLPDDVPDIVKKMKLL